MGMDSSNPEVRDQERRKGMEKTHPQNSGTERE